MRFAHGLFAVGLLAISLVACGDKGSGDGDDTGGSSTTAGTSSGGSSTTAGTSSNQGGDDTGNGGTGATSPTGGTSSGGSGGSGGPVEARYTFDTDEQGFVVVSSSGATMPDVVEPVPLAEIMLAHNADEGEPDPGSLQVDIPFSAASQYVSVGVNIPQTMPLDLSGKTISAMVMVQSGYGEAVDLMTAPANAKLYVKTGMTYVYASAAVANITEIGVWTEIQFELMSPQFVADMEAYDLTQVLEIGIQFDTNSASTTAQPAVVLVDSISY